MITIDDIKAAVEEIRPGCHSFLNGRYLDFEHRDGRKFFIELKGGWGSQDFDCSDGDIQSYLDVKLRQPDSPHIRRRAAGPRDEWILQHAADEYFQEDRILIDGMQDRVIISENPEENGAYVEAWVWVDFAETHLDRRDPMIVEDRPENACRNPECKNTTDNGEGYDGYCGTCADQKSLEKDA